MDHSEGGSSRVRRAPRCGVQRICLGRALITQHAPMASSGTPKQVMPATTLHALSLLPLRSGNFSVSRRPNRHRKQCIDRAAHVVRFSGDESVYAVFEFLSAFTPVWHGHRPVPELARFDLPVDQRHQFAMTRVLPETINQ